MTDPEHSTAETEETAQEVRDDINRIVGIDQSMEYPGWFTKEELEGMVEYITRHQSVATDDDPRRER
jgi:Mg2+/Co2+ transporter CorB